MADNPKPSSWPLPFETWLPSAEAIFSLQKRNLTALNRGGVCIMDAAMQIANKEAQILEALSEVARANSQLFAIRGDASKASEAQMEAGRDLVERLVRQAREIADVSQDCWSELVQEFQECSRDNLNYFQQALQTEASRKERREGETAPLARARAVGA
jgi:hypothetical protein